MLCLVCGEQEGVGCGGLCTCAARLVASRPWRGGACMHVFSVWGARGGALKFASVMPDASPSLRLDHVARRKSEIDAINGMVPVVSAELGLSAPYNETLAAVIRRREEAF